MTTQPPFVPSDGAGGLGPRGGEVGELLGEHRRRPPGRPRSSVVTQHDRRVGAVLGLDQQVGGEPHAGRRCASAITRLSVGPSSIIVVTPWRCISTWAQRDRRRAGTDDLAHLRDRLGAEAQRGDAGRAVDAEHVGDAELAADDEHGRVDGAVAAGDRRHDERRSGGTPATVAGTPSW